MSRKSPPISRYSLDVAFSSATQPIPGNQTEAILAMGYGFSELSGRMGSHWQGKGQRTLPLTRPCTCRFTAFDTAEPHLSKLKSIVIDFSSGKTPFVKDGKPVKNPITVTATELSSGENGQSAGCNVTGFFWRTPDYTVDPNIPLDEKFACVIKVNTSDNETFVIDPEMQVEGGGVPKGLGAGAR